ncbi:CPBP family intramembrane glutamic endopeptidase [Cesiribacter sp. SM1]|uniref:CPBP family intramembrane glutamic endopeptidase n=1 Tax=Cesiribacter sp. SM1 TaxID=2861196 RepID=UPI001CD23566|nr:CPBP family intramembrane glutamic endopeptidase [Cesiribacter sp. SM1]
MVFRQPEPDKRDLPPGRSLILLLIYFFVGLFVGQFLAVVISMAIFGTGFNETSQVAGSLNHPNARYILFVLQFFSAAGGFIAGPLMYVYRYERHRLSTLINSKGLAIIPMLLAIVLTLAFMMVNSIVIEWNANLTLPETFKTFESWMQEKEVYLQRLTDYLTTFSSGLDFGVAFIIIALLPAVGEELFFRGLMQPLIRLKIGNAHAAIWLTAFIFSVFHFQFYGLLPRLFLGALFGYLYYWSGNLLMPILGHFINNGFTLVMRYLYQLHLIEFDSSGTESLAGTTIAIFLFLGIAAIVGFRGYFSKESIT